MSLKIHTRTIDEVAILDLSGRITLGEGSVTIRDAVRRELEKGGRTAQPEANALVAQSGTRRKTPISVLAI